MSLEHGNNSEEFAKLASELNVQDPETKIGKPEQNESASLEQKNESQKEYIDKVQARITQMKSELNDAQEKAPLISEVVNNQEEAQRLDEELKKTIREYMSSDNSADKASQDKQAELNSQIEKLRNDSQKIRDENFRGMPIDSQTRINNAMKIDSLKTQIAEQEDILEANKKELA